MMEGVQTMKGAEAVSGVCHDVWVYVALAEFVLLLLLGVHLYLLRRRRPARGKRDRAAALREGDIDFANVINSSFKAKALYDELKKKCHPDRFAQDEALNAKATEIFGLLVKHRYDYAALCRLRERAETELNVKCKDGK